ncbi:hypothetical protein ACI65C_000261 [Semiaphis heraclei]
MSIRNVFNRHLNLKYLWVQCLVQRKLCRQLSVQSIKYQNCLNVHHSNIHVVGDRLLQNINTYTTKFPSWKWWLAVSLFNAGYNGKNIFDLINQGSAKELTRFLKDNSKAANELHLFGWAPIHVAASNNKYEQLAVLLKSGADPNLSDGFSNCINVARKQNINPSNVLSTREYHFMHNFNVNATVISNIVITYFSGSLLQNIESLKVLMDYGADPNLKAVSGVKPIDLVTDIKIYEMLADYEKDFNNKKEAEIRKKFPLELILKQKIIGQENAINEVASAIRRKGNGWTDGEHPLVFLFLGSSGIGKTELAKQIASYLHKNNKDGFIKLDMSEYQEKHEVAKMIGSPPGYVGYDDGGYLTKQLAKNPNAVVLFDEGRITDGKGKTIVFKNAIFVMTSNLASNEIAEHALELRNEQRQNKLIEDSWLSNKKTEKHEEVVTFISKKFKDKIVKPILKKHFKRNEFLGRINEVVYFLPFSEMELKFIVQRELQYWKELALKKHNIQIEWDSAVEHVIIGAYDVNYGARSIKHEVERSVVSQLAKAHEKGLLNKKTVVKIEADITKGDHGNIFLRI